jgi:hypothetical protein
MRRPPGGIKKTVAIPEICRANIIKHCSANIEQPQRRKAQSQKLDQRKTKFKIA